nr:copper chaperone [Cryptococcus depauperatus CBS 7855]
MIPRRGPGGHTIDEGRLKTAEDQSYLIMTMVLWLICFPLMRQAAIEDEASICGLDYLLPAWVNALLEQRGTRYRWSGTIINSIPGATPTVPAYLFNVEMTCTGCSGAINRVLGKNIVAPNAYHISLSKQLVLVWGPNLPPLETVKEKIAKTGKTINEDREVLDGAQLPQLESTA